MLLPESITSSVFFIPGLAGLLVAFFVVGFYLARRSANHEITFLEKQSKLKIEQVQHQLAEKVELLTDTTQQFSVLQERNSAEQVKSAGLVASEAVLREQIDQQLIRIDVLDENVRELQQQLSVSQRQHDTLLERYTNQTQALREKQALLESAEKRLTNEFEQLANRIFEQKSETFREASQSSLENLLKPFREQINGFQQQVSRKSESDIQHQTLLKKELDDLKSLNLRMSEEALNLTKALKGESKTQGNWGEVVLQRLLDQAGLAEGREYDIQVALKDEKGSRYQPDVVIHLPQEKDIVIDSKVSLTAYERYSSSEDDIQTQLALKEHISSLRQHIKDLGNKNYQNLMGIKTLDYVLMFVPIETAFLVAIQQEPELIKLALDRNIMIVSPTNLLVALRTIHNIWRVEQQNQNAQEIANRAGKLYDKFVGFVDDLSRAEVALTKAGKEFEAAKGKLCEGPGNLVRQTTMLVEMGANSTKQLEKGLVESALSSSPE